MAKEKQKKDFKSLSTELKALRKRPVPQAQIDRFNKIVEDDDRRERSDREERPRKIASPKDREATS